MIAMLHGTLFSKQPSEVLIEVSGIGYEVLVPLSTYDRMPTTGGECRLLIAHIVREDDELLFGFATPEERQAFRLLLTIGGIGPRLALCILSGLTVAELKRCVAEGDVKRLSSVKGIGRKTANVILNIAFHQPTLAVDTHIHRVANRTGMVRGKTPEKTEQALLKKVPDKHLLHAHHYLILHGRYTCKARKPDCPGCVVNHCCNYPEKTSG